MNAAFTDIELMLGMQPDFGDPEEEQRFTRLYTELHDSLLDPRTVRVVADEQRLAHLRALLTQHGLDESRLPWEISASYNLRLAEHLERLAARNRR